MINAMLVGMFILCVFVYVHCKKSFRLDIIYVKWITEMKPLRSPVLIILHPTVYEQIQLPYTNKVNTKSVGQRSTRKPLITRGETRYIGRTRNF